MAHAPTHTTHTHTQHTHLDQLHKTQQHTHTHTAHTQHTLISYIKPNSKGGVHGGHGHGGYMRAKVGLQCIRLIYHLCVYMSMGACVRVCMCVSNMCCTYTTNILEKSCTHTIPNNTPSSPSTYNPLLPLPPHHTPPHTSCTVCGSKCNS